MKSNIFRAFVLLYLGMSIAQSGLSAAKGGLLAITWNLLPIALWLTFAWKFYKRSPGWTLVLGVLFTFGAIARPLLFHIGAPNLGYTEAELSDAKLRMYLDEVAVIFCALCCFDLWSGFRKRPNKALEPTPTAVTSPASQESRQP